MALIAAKLYKVAKQNYRGSNDSPAVLLVKGYSASVQIKGSMALPALIANMVNIHAAITANGMYSLDALPEYIYITGTFTGIELVNYVEVENLGALS
jgi:hypothetical protein